METVRCGWAEREGPEQAYHDRVWGVPVHDDKELFRMLMLEGQQAGLSWSTILRKMDALDEAYDGFDPAVLIRYGEDKTAELLQNPGIIRNRLKVRAAAENARAYFRLCEKHGSLDAFLWATWTELRWSTTGSGFPRCPPLRRSPTGSAAT